MAGKTDYIVFILVSLLLIFCPKGTSCQIHISQSPNPANAGEGVVINCTTNEATSPVIFDWNVDTDSFYILFPSCAYLGAARPYTPSGCSSQGTTHTASMIISVATNNDNGKTWSCNTASAGTSAPIRLIVNEVSSEIGISQSPNPVFVGQDVTVTCTVTEATAPRLIDWNVDTDSFPILFPSCAYTGEPRPYTPSGCSSQGTTHTASMIISAASSSDNGKIWSCTTTSAGISEKIKLVVNNDNVSGSDGGLPGGARARIIIGVLVVVGLSWLVVS